MFSAIRHALALRKQRKHDAKLAHLRSPHWPALERQHLAEQPRCFACDGVDRAQVHHVRPFHLRPDLELDPENLVTLCMAKDKHCHLAIGHGGDFRAFNPLVINCALLARNGLVAAAVKKARSLRKYE